MDYKESVKKLLEETSFSFEAVSFSCDVPVYRIINMKVGNFKLIEEEEIKKVYNILKFASSRIKNGKKPKEIHIPRFIFKDHKCLLETKKLLVVNILKNVVFQNESLETICFMKGYGSEFPKYVRRNRVSIIGLEKLLRLDVYITGKLFKIPTEYLRT